MSLSDISDLTDLSSEDDVPLSRSSKAKKPPKEYKISHVLRAPRTAQYTAKSLYDQIIDNSIDLDPEYQRDVVWQEEKQSGLIDSILRNYYIPPIIFAVIVQDDGSELRTCIDGKQRLTSIQRFIDGQIPHKDSYTNEKLWFKSTVANAKRKLLPQHLRTLFLNKQIVCVEYTGLDNDQEREIFQRVQLGVALTPAERLQALVGPWSTVIREIQNQVLGEEGFEGYLDWGHTRGRDFQCLATIGYLIESHPKTTVPGTKTLEKWLQKSDAVPNRLRTDLHETFHIFVTLARDKKYSGSLNRPTRVSPIEFIMIGVLIYLKRKTLSLTQISSAIEKMRKDVRASHTDIRSNTRVTKHLTEFMKKIKVSELKSDGEGDKPAAQVIAQASKPAKRRRPIYSDDSDSEPSSNVKSAKRSTDTPSVEASKPSRKASASQLKTKNVKKAVATPIPPTSTGSKPSQTSSRTTNNSLSILPPAPPKPLPSTSPAIQIPRKKTSPPISFSSNDHNVHLGSTTANSARHPPLTIQTSSGVKVESPQMSSLDSPAAVLSAIDRLAPIRAAKASLGAPSPVSQGGEARAMLGPGASALQPPVDLPQKPVVHTSAVYQVNPLQSRQPLPSQSTQFSSQQGPANSGQGRPIPAQLEGTLQSLRSQFPQLANPTRSSNSDVMNLAISGQNLPPSISTSRPSTLPPIPSQDQLGGGANNSSHTSRRYSLDTLQGVQNASMSNMPAYPNQAFGANVPPRSSTRFGSLGNVTSHQSASNPSTPTSAGPHALPQRPAFTSNAPNSSMRADNYSHGPSRSVSSESANQDHRRGSYSNDRYHGYHPSDDRRSSRHDRSHDYEYHKQSWSRPRH